MATVIDQRAAKIGITVNGTQTISLAVKESGRVPFTNTPDGHFLAGPRTVQYEEGRQDMITTCEISSVKYFQIRTGP